MIFLVLSFAFLVGNAHAEITECDFFYRLVEAGFYPSVRSQDTDGAERDSLKLAAKYAIENAAEGGKNVGAVELADLLLRPSGASKPLREELQAWAAKYEIPFELRYPDQIEAMAAAMKAQGNFEPNVLVQIGSSMYRLKVEPMQWMNNFVDEQVWNYAVARGLFLVADPHDSISHLLSMRNPRVSSGVKGLASLRYKVISVERSLLDEKDPRWTNFTKLKKALERVRRETYENLSYTTKGKPPKLVLQGNAGYNVIPALRNAFKFPEYPDRFKELTRRLVSSVSLDPNDLDGMDRFMRSQPRLTKSFNKALGRMGGGDAAKREKLALRLEAIIVGLAKKHQSAANEVAFTDLVLQDLGVAVSRDWTLGPLFSLDNRLTYLEESKAFYGAYAEWYAKEVGLEPSLLKAQAALLAPLEPKN